MVVLFKNAVKYTSPEKQDDLEKNAALEINKAVMNVISNLKGSPSFSLILRQEAAIQYRLEAF